jgi:beta-N-acetylhexosaminidase
VRAAACLLAALCAVALAGAAAARPAGAPSLEQLVGRRLVVAMRGTAPDGALLGRVGRGEVGGVILFGANIRTAPQLRALTAALRGAARAGGVPEPLILVDQEGGDVRRLRWAPPSRSAEELGRAGDAAVRAAGRATGAALRAAGVDVDLAPVADVPAAGSFLAAERRAFSGDAARAARVATAFARGLAEGGAAATAKHFPGLGRATRSTDTDAVTITATRAELERDLVPFRSLVAADVPLVMLSNAAYAALDGKPAAWSPAVQTLLRRTLGFRGATITDALEAVALTRHRPVASTAVLAAQAGTDLLLVTGSEAESDAVYRRLLAAARSGALPRPGLERSYRRIEELAGRI